MTCVCETDRREDFYEVWSAVSDWVSMSRVTVPSSYVEVAPPSGQEPLSRRDSPGQLAAFGNAVGSPCVSGVERPQ